jgi:hypothetical protein
MDGIPETRSEAGESGHEARSSIHFVPPEFGIVIRDGGTSTFTPVITDGHARTRRSSGFASERDTARNDTALLHSMVKLRMISAVLASAMSATVLRGSPTLKSPAKEGKTERRQKKAKRRQKEGKTCMLKLTQCFKKKARHACLN